VADYDDRMQQVVERALAAKFSFWSALLTAHTVLLSVSTALIFTGSGLDKTAFRYVGYMAIASMILVLLTFTVAKTQYETIGRRLAEFDKELSDVEQARDLKHANVRWWASIVCEYSATIGLLAEAAIFVWTRGGT